MTIGSRCAAIEDIGQTFLCSQLWWKINRKKKRGILSFGISETFLFGSKPFVFGNCSSNVHPSVIFASLTNQWICCIKCVSVLHVLLRCGTTCPCSLDFRTNIDGISVFQGNFRSKSLESSQLFFSRSMFDLYNSSANIYDILLLIFK